MGFLLCNMIGHVDGVVFIWYVDFGLGVVGVHLIDMYGFICAY